MPALKIHVGLNAQQVKTLCERKRRKRLREIWVRDNGPCRQCGSDQDLEIDHIDPSQKAFTINWVKSRKSLEEELKKCQVLCQPCHLKKTLEWKRKNQRGELNPRSKLTEEKIREIRLEYKSGISGIQLFRKHKISKTQIYRVLKNESWSHI